MAEHRILPNEDTLIAVMTACLNANQPESAVATWWELVKGEYNFEDRLEEVLQQQQSKVLAEQAKPVIPVTPQATPQATPESTQASATPTPAAEAKEKQAEPVVEKEEAEKEEVVKTLPVGARNLPWSNGVVKPQTRRAYALIFRALSACTHLILLVLDLSLRKCI